VKRNAVATICLFAPVCFAGIFFCVDKLGAESLVIALQSTG
jgi:hypothetical protein